jgi:hypothetical protein
MYCRLPRHIRAVEDETRQIGMNGALWVFLLPNGTQRMVQGRSRTPASHLQCCYNVKSLSGSAAE